MLDHLFGVRAHVAPAVRKGPPPGTNSEHELRVWGARQEPLASPYPLTVATPLTFNPSLTLTPNPSPTR